jgi:hypothetical protein
MDDGGTKSRAIVVDGPTHVPLLIYRDNSLRFATKDSARSKVSGSKIKDIIVTKNSLGKFISCIYMSN